MTTAGFSAERQISNGLTYVCVCVCVGQMLLMLTYNTTSSNFG